MLHGVEINFRLRLAMARRIRLRFHRRCATGRRAREPNFILLLWLVLAARKGLTARVLPAFAGVVPMKTKLREIGADGFGWLFGKCNPYPFANYFGQLVLGRHPAAEFFEDFFNGEFAVEVAFGEVDVRPNASSGTGRWEIGVRRLGHLSLALSARGREGI